MKRTTDGENILKYLIRVQAKLASRDVPYVPDLTMLRFFEGIAFRITFVLIKIHTLCVPRT